MENRFFFTLCSDCFPEEILLETQSDIPISELLNDILRLINWPIEVDDKPVEYTLKTEEKILEKTDTLVSANVKNFESIWITPVDVEKNKECGEENRENEPANSPTGTITSAPYWSRIPVERPSLIHPDGYLFELDKLPTLIGRQGGERTVQIDLSEFEKDKLISSRSHAEIILANGEYCLRALNARNGTFIGRDEMKPGEVRPLLNNDIIQFGRGGVRLIFRKPD